MMKHYSIIPQGSSHIIYQKPERDVYVVSMMKMMFRFTNAHVICIKNKK